MGLNSTQVSELYQMVSTVENVGAGSFQERYYEDDDKLAKAIYDAGYTYIEVPFETHLMGYSVEEYDDSDLYILSRLGEGDGWGIPYDISDEIQKSLGATNYTVVGINGSRYLAEWTSEEFSNRLV